MMSMRRFLFVSIALLVAAMTLVATAATYLQAYHEVDELFDAQLVQNARLIALLSSDNDYALDPAVMHATGPGHSYERYVAVQRWSNDGTLVLASDSVPEIPLSEFNGGLTRNQIGNKDWHVFTQQLPNGDWLMVAESGRARAELVEGAALAVVVPFLIAIPVVLLLVTIAIRRGLRPLSQLAAAVRLRDHRNLHALNTPAAQVRELAPMELALNELLAQLQDVLAREQRFTADAAHELRTLLTVLKLHADNARSLADPVEVRASLDNLQVGVTRATRMVAQLLSLARIDPQGVESLQKRTAVLPVLRQSMADLTPMAETRGQTLELADQAASAEVNVRAEALDILLRNLIENALRYSPDKGRVDVDVTLHDSWVVISIEDDGEGVPEELSQRVTERFFRGHQDGYGAGLGLSIVSRILQLVGGSIRFVPRTSAGRACVRVNLPSR